MKNKKGYDFHKLLKAFTKSNYRYKNHVYKYISACKDLIKTGCFPSMFLWRRYK